MTNFNIPFEGKQIEPLVTLPEVPGEGTITAANGLATKKVVLYKSNSNAAEAFEVFVPVADGELLYGACPAPVVQFYEYVSASNLISVAASAINASWLTGKITEEAGLELEFKFTTHAVKPLKKGEVLVIVVS